MQKTGSMHFLIVIILLAVPAHGLAAGSLDLEQLIEEALANNPEVAVSEKNRDALWERPPQAAAWDDPRLTFGVSNVPVDDFDFNKQDMTQKYVSVRQNIPFPGISSLRRKSAEEEAKSAESELENTRMRIVRDVKQAYYELYFINESIRIAGANEDLLKKFVEITQARYEVGSGLQEDILKAQVELYKLQERLISLRQRKKTVQAQLKRLTGRDASAALAGQPVLKATEFHLSRAELEETALAASPLLRALSHSIDQSEAEHRLAKKMYFPKFSLTAAYGQRDDRVNAKPSRTRVTQPDGTFSDVTTEPLNFDKDRPDFFTFLVGIDIPLWFKSKQSRRVAEAYHRLAQAKSRYDSARNDISFRLSDSFARVSRGRDLIALYRDNIVPQADQSLEADIAAYQVDKIDFLTLLNSQITLFNYEIQSRRVLSEYEKDLAELEFVVGRRLF